MTIVEHDTYGCPECLVPDGQARKEHWRPLPPPHRAPLSRQICSPCGEPLAQALVDLGAMWHPLCGPVLDPVLAGPNTGVILTSLGLEKTR